MCGIAGCFFGDGEFAERETAALAAMGEALAHRGPDGKGFHRGEGCALVHRRLAVQDLTDAAAQPMVHPAGPVLCYNGELYNTGDLRRELAERGHTFRGHGDAEALLAACVEWGVGGALQRLNGIFAFALFDPRTGELHVARDRAGVKPLYHGADAAGRFWFASELRPLVEHSGLDRTLDRGGLGGYALLGFVPGPGTIYRGVRTLRPGGWTTVTSSGLRERVWPAPVRAEVPPYADAVARLEQLLTRAVERQLISDVPLGAFLSGGLDSSLLSALITRRLGRELSTFSIGYYDDPVIDESGWADLVARHLGTRHTLFHVTLDDAKAAIEPTLARQGQPFADSSLLPTYMVSRLARQHLTVALSGDGADELFAGYSKYLVESQRDWLLRWPRLARSAQRRLANWLSATRASKTGEFVRQWRKFIAAAELPASERWLALQAMLAPVGRAARLYRPESLDVAPLETRVAELLRGDDDDLARMLRVDFALTLPDRMLFKVDMASMANGLEVRVPFLDQDVVDFAAACPSSYKLQGRLRKRILRDVAAPLLPPAMSRRPKQGFDLPIGRWLAGPLREQFLDLVRSTRASVLLDTAAVERLFDGHAAGREAADAALWAAFCFAHWAQHNPVNT